MASKVHFELEGSVAIQRAFASLSGSQTRAVVRQGVKAAGSVVIKAMKPRIPDRKRRDAFGKLGGLKRSAIQIPSSRYAGAESRRRGIIGTRVGFKRPDGSHAHLVELGHRIVTKDGRDTGRRARPFPFMRPAYDATRSQQVKAIQDKVRQGVRKIAAKERARK